MARAIFISEQWLKDNTPMPSNMDVQKIYPFYFTAQDTYIRDMLGDSLYNRLSNAILIKTFTTEEAALLKLVRPCLAYYTILESLPFISTEIKNIGVVRTADDKQTSGSNYEVNKIENKTRDKAEYYAERIKKYLCNNRNLFPEYNFNNEDVNPSKTNTAYTSDLYIDPDYSDRIDEIDYNLIKQYYRQ